MMRHSTVIASGIIVLTACTFPLLRWSVLPVPLEQTEDGNAVLLGAESHLMPLVRGINFIGHTMRKKLVPLTMDGLKQEALSQMMKGDNQGGEIFTEPDFGDLADWEAFNKLVQVADERTHLLGRIFARQQFLEILLLHLHITKFFRDIPTLSRETIEEPIFLAAFTRTGATFLYQVLADTFADELAAVTNSDIYGGPLRLEYAKDPMINRPQHEKAKFAMVAMKMLVSPLAIMHENISPEDAQEDSGWYTYSLRGVSVPFSWPSTWHSWNIFHNLAETAVYNQRLLETLLKIKQYRAGKKLRFLLKAPEHLYGLPHLVQTYPNAKFITVSRNEESMFPSKVLLTDKFQSMNSEPRFVQETVGFAEILVCQERKALQIAHNGSYDVLPIRFEDGLFTNTLEIIERIAKHTHLPWDNARQDQARKVIAQRLSWKKTKIQYRIEDFMLTKDNIRERLVSACDDIPNTYEEWNARYGH